jgi:hypothetical protein
MRGGHKSGPAIVVTSRQSALAAGPQYEHILLSWLVPGNIPHSIQGGRGTLGMKLGHILRHEGTAVAWRT